MNWLEGHESPRSFCQENDMCGIFARVAAEPVADTLIEGLKRLEYRGYDSAGIATMEQSGIERICAVGKVGALEAAVRSGPPKGRTGIGHTRWATHGAPSARMSRRALPSFTTASSRTIANCGRD
jgi:glucosamine 6-phosphate synthetase-like amidotransferase/phosphosugar isomerase protein